MKPRTKLQKKVAELSPRLRPLTDAQRRWADTSLFGDRGWLCKKRVWCERCGHVFGIDNPLHSQMIGEVCPSCGRTLRVEMSKRRKSDDEGSMTVITTCGGFQVLRFWYFTLHARPGGPAEVRVTEYFRNWIASDGRDVTEGLGLDYNNYGLRFVGSDFQIRESSHPEMYVMEGNVIWPRVRIIPELRLRGWLRDWTGRNITHYRLMKSLLTYPRTETLLKAGQYRLAENCAMYGMPDDIWPSVRICLRRGYRVYDPETWRDLVRILRTLGKDVLNAAYVCPSNLKEAHDRWNARLMELERRREREALAKKLVILDEEYRKRMGSVLSLVLTDGDLTVRPLASVTEFYDEGKAMHHCVYSAGYWKRADSLVMTARVDGRRMETVEVNTAECIVRQSRGVCNSTTEWHDKIISLVMKNMPKMRDIFIKNNI